MATPRSLLLYAVPALVLTALAIWTLWTLGSWLPRLIGRLDRFLARIGFGKYTARFLTWIESRSREKPSECDQGHRSDKGQRE